MLALATVSEQLIAAKGPFLTISPTGWALIGPPRLAQGCKYGVKGVRMVRNHRAGMPVRMQAVDVCAGPLAGKCTAPILRPLKQRIAGAYHRASQRGNLFRRPPKPDAKGLDGQRSWIAEPGRYRMVIVYHEADKAGPHIDVHIGALSIIYRVKPELYAQLKFNADGSLTVASKEKLISHVRAEIANGSRVPQNLDHPDDQASYSWLTHADGPQGYGAGKSRQVVLTSEVDIFKAYEDGPIEFFAPALAPDRALYLYQIYPGTAKTAPICIWGMKTSHAPAVEDRLHLHMIDPSELDRWEREGKIDLRTATAKYDGSSVYLHITPKGTTAWSPRISKRSGERIEYTPKINGLAGITSPTGETIQGMGELMMYREGKGGKKLWLDHATAGGILNGHELLPPDVKPVVVLYRVDRIGRQRTIDMEFFEQRSLAAQIVRRDPAHLMLPELMAPRQAKKEGYEGIVAARPGGGVVTACKVKWWADERDWRIDSVDFAYSPKGNVSGVVWFTDVESGKRFKLGPGSVGDRALCEQMMADPTLYVGSVMKVRGREGHIGRAAKVSGFHQDKGFAPR